MANYYETLTNQYSINKTLCFRLEPIGNTFDNIQKNHILDKDEQRKKDYVLVKGLIDKYHIKIINEALQGKKLSGLEDLSELYFMNKRDDKQEKALEEGFTSLRKQIADRLRKHEKYQLLGKKELITNELPQTAQTQEEKDALKSFEKFTTYFTSFNKVRENLYSDEKKSSTVAYRLIEENLPRFLDNIIVYEMLKKYAVDISNVQDVLNKYRIKNIDEVFLVDGFNYVLTQEGIDIYDFIVGELNKSINLYNQQEKNSTYRKTTKIPKMKVLYKQLLIEHEKAFVIEEFRSDEELLDTLRHFAEEMFLFLTEENEKGIYQLLDILKGTSGQGIYVKNDASLTTLSYIVYKKWNQLTDAISRQYDTDYQGRKKINTEKYQEEKTKNLKKVKSYSVDILQEMCKGIETVNDSVSILECFSLRLSADIEDIIENYHRYIGEIKNFDTSKMLMKYTDGVHAIKDYLDAIKRLEADVKLLSGTGMETDKDFEFYGEYAAAYDQIQKVDKLYNMVRNYLTKKPFSTEKMKLNFDNPIFLEGWPDEIAHSSFILASDNNYYLGVMDSKKKSDFAEFPKPQSIKDTIYKMKYLQMADAQKDIQNLMVIDGETVKKNGRKEKQGIYAGENIILEDLKCKYLPQEINDIRLSKAYSVLSDNFSREKLNKFIEYYQERVKEYYSSYTFNFKEPLDYKDFGDFTDDINRQAYQLHFEPVSKAFINNQVEIGNLYLFRIYSKDFSEHSKGNYNLHTIYWKMLFDERNLSNLVYKLNGGAEVFYRPASIKPEDTVVHKKGTALINKNASNDKKKSKFEYDIVKDKRYTEDKFEFHVPITMNYTALGDGKNSKFNRLVNSVLKKSENVHVIGIDRGERNLLYIVVVDPQGNIVEQFSLNSIISHYGERNVPVDYHELLNGKEKQRDEARRSWSSIENIKDLKEGYMSQVVHVIAELVLKYNAVIAIEDLNFGFMRDRQKVEKQVYQKFEKRLIDKLNYLVIDKSRTQIDPYQTGGSLNALQLTGSFESFNKLGKQTGIIYYVPAWMTSKTDPTTGFANLFYLKYENREKAREFFGRFDSIIYNPEQDYFEFAFDYRKFTFKADGSKTNWTICSFGERIEKYRNPEANNNFEDRIANPTELLKELFEKYNIFYQSGDNVVGQICKIEESSFYNELYFCLRLILQIRNSSSDGTRDYLQSCVMNEEGGFYNSECAGEKLPKDADANGAYNIARKGLWMLQQIRETDDENLTKNKLIMSNKDWLKYAQENRNRSWHG